MNIIMMDILGTKHSYEEHPVVVFISSLKTEDWKMLHNSEALIK